MPVSCFRLVRKAGLGHPEAPSVPPEMVRTAKAVGSTARVVHEGSSRTLMTTNQTSELMHTSRVQSRQGHVIAKILFLAGTVLILPAAYLFFVAPYFTLGQGRSVELNKACKAQAGCKRLAVVWHPAAGSAFSPKLSVLVQTAGDPKTRRKTLEAIEVASAMGGDPLPVIEHHFKDQ